MKPAGLHGLHAPLEKAVAFLTISGQHSNFYRNNSKTQQVRYRGESPD